MPSFKIQGFRWVPGEGDVFVDWVRVLERRRGRRYPVPVAWGLGRLGVGLGRKGAHLDTAPFWKGFGAAMSSSPWEWLWNGDEDVASPFHAGAVSRCARRKAPCIKRLDGGFPGVQRLAFPR